MAVSCVDPSRRRPLRPAFALLALLAAVSSFAFADATPRRDDLRIEVDARSTEIDFRNNTAVLRTVIIREGDVRVEADEATARGGVDNFENNQWVLTGNVRIIMPDGSLQADRAVVSFVDNRIVRAVITGSPASFEQTIEETCDLARGRAQTIEYDVVGGTVRLDGDSYLTDGRNDIKGTTLVYNITEQRVVTQGDGRVHITINPASAEAQRNREKAQANCKPAEEPEQRLEDAEKTEPQPPPSAPEPAGA